MTTATSLEFLTVKEAAQRSGKAQITIRRLVRSIAEDEKHPDREHLRPAPAELKKLLKSKKPFSYTISADLLEKAYAKGSSSTPKSTVANSDVIDVLRKQASILERELEAKNKLLEQMNERQRETNILMKDLHDQLQLGSGKEEVVDVANSVKRSWWRRWM